MLPATASDDALIAQLRRWTAIPGISGHEDAVARAFADECQALGAAEVKVDALANVIARFEPTKTPASGKTIALCAHLDTVGLMVKRHNPDSTLGVVKVGGVNVKALPGTAVVVHTPHGARNALIGVRSQHQERAGDLQTNVDDLYVDGGDSLVHIAAPGMPITYAPQFVEMGALVASPSLDDRAGVVALQQIAAWMGSAQMPHTVYLIGTAQEETTCMGATAALQAVRPDVAIFVDGTLAYDTPDTRGMGEVALGDGVVLPTMLYVSGLNGWHAHPKLLDHLDNIGAQGRTSLLSDAIHGLMSDARAAALLGIPSAIVGIPMRGKHAPLETLALGDLHSAIALLRYTLEADLPDLGRG